jgi:hypothetical protein
MTATTAADVKDMVLPPQSPGYFLAGTTYGN